MPRTCMLAGLRRDGADFRLLFLDLGHPKFRLTCRFSLTPIPIILHCIPFVYSGITLPVFIRGIGECTVRGMKDKDYLTPLLRIARHPAHDLMSAQHPMYAAYTPTPSTLLCKPLSSACKLSKTWVGVKEGFLAVLKIAEPQQSNPQSSDFGWWSESDHVLLYKMATSRV